MNVMDSDSPDEELLDQEMAYLIEKELNNDDTQ